ncbi:Hypothetical predicted protein [Octopus vulgaris]|uniref:Uncharacterized protein n=1 Tax=Octopus vulgaris TaxID=6645 RepID=A0AA36B2N7_OCTVU|nr:Hypothetical predicted protein [Octopus vulgaris]
MVIYSVKEKLKTTLCRMGCRTILPNMEKLSHCGPLPITSSNVGLDYGNHVIEALLKMSSDTDDDEDQSFEQSKVVDTRNKNLLCPSESTPMPPVILHSQTTNYKLYCSPMSQSSASNMVQSPTNQPVSLKTHGILSPPMSSSLSSSLSSVSSWPKKSTKYSKEDSFTKFISDKRQTCSNDEQSKPIELNVTTPRLEKRPTYANLSSIHRTEANDEGNAEPLSTSSLSSLTDGYPAFTGDTSDCPYGQNYNKPRGLTKFEYHSHYIKQCRIEKTARTKKVWERSPKRQQVISRKRKLIKKCQLENYMEQNTPVSAHHERKKKMFHSNTKSSRKRRIVNSNLKSKNNSSRNFQNQFSETADLLNETIGRLGQSDLVLTDSGRDSKNEHPCLESHTSVILSDTSYPSSSQTWSTPESMNTEVISGTSSYGLFKSRIDPGQFTSSPLPNISDSSSGPCQELPLPSSSLNLSSVEEHISASDSLDMSLEEGNKAFVQIETSNEKSQLQLLCNASGDTKHEIVLSDSSVSLSVSLGERPDCVGQSCSSDSEAEAENENVEASDKSNDSNSFQHDSNSFQHDSNSFQHASNILSSTRNSQKDISLERKGPVIISPLSIDMGSPSLISFEENNQHDELSLSNNKSFLNDLSPKNTNLVTDKKKNFLKLPTQSFSASASKMQNAALHGSSSTSSVQQNAATTTTTTAAVSKQDHNQILAKSKKVPHSAYSTNQLCKDKSSYSNQSLPADSFQDTSSVYFSPGKSSHCHKGLSPFSPISNISKDNQMKPEGAKPKVHRQVAKKNHDKRANNNNSSSNRRHRGMLEHRRSRSHNKENTDLSDFEQSSNKHFFEREFICSSRETPHISKDSGLGACRKSYQSPQIASLANSPALTVAGASTDPIESNEIKRNRQPIVDGFRLRNKKAVMKKFWNFQKKFIRKNPQNKDDTEFKTLAHV